MTNKRGHSVVRDEIHNIRDVWQEGYERLLKDARKSGTVHQRDAVHERRVHPRFPVASRDVSAAEERGVRLQDMSISGLAFESANAHYPARSLTVSLANVFSTETEVLACEALPSRNPDGPVRYRVRCRFLDEEHGLQFLTLTLELERVEGA